MKNENEKYTVSYVPEKNSSAFEDGSEYETGESVYTDLYDENDGKEKNNPLIESFIKSDGLDDIIAKIDDKLGEISLLRERGR